MTSTTGEDHGLDPAVTHRKIPADTLAIRIMIARVSAGLTVKQAAERCGLNYGSWSNWEAGKRPLDYMEVTDAISEGLGVDPEWLRRGGPLTPAPPVQRSRRSRHTDWPENTSGYSRKPAKRTNRPPVHSNGFRRPGSVRRSIAA